MLPEEAFDVKPEWNSLVRRSQFNLAPHVGRQAEGKGRCSPHAPTVRQSLSLPSSASSEKLLKSTAHRARPSRMNTPSFSMRLAPELRAELEARAKADGRSLGNYLEQILKKHLAQQAARRPTPRRPRSSGVDVPPKKPGEETS
mgnify:CR=1 FL=1